MKNNDKLKVGLLCRDFPPNLGGVAVYSSHLAWALAQRDIHVAVLARESSCQWASHEPYELHGILPTLPGRQRFSSVRHFRLWRRWKSRMVEWLRQFQPDFLLSTAWFPPVPQAIFCSLPCRKGALFHGADLLGQSHYGAFRRWLFRSQVRRLDGVFTNSHYTADCLTRISDWPGRVVVTGCGIEPAAMPAPLERRDARQRLQLPQDVPVLLSLCRLIPRKGIDMTLRALPLLRNRWPDLVYLIAGRGSDEPRLRELARQEGCEDNVRFAGAFEADRLAEYYCASDVFVMPTRLEAGRSVEGFGIVYTEAGFYGVPVVASAVGGVVDAVTDGENGLFVDPLSPESIADGIGRVFEDEGLRRTLGAGGHRRATQTDTWQAVADRVLSGIRGFLAGTQGALE